MENIKLPLDLNLNPIGCLCPETSGTVEPGVDYTVEEPGVYRILFAESGETGETLMVLRIHLPDREKYIEFAGFVGTIEYIYLPKGAVLKRTNEEDFLYIVKMM